MYGDTVLRRFPFLHGLMHLPALLMYTLRFPVLDLLQDLTSLQPYGYFMLRRLPLRQGARQAPMEFCQRWPEGHLDFPILRRVSADGV